jgi:putative restriction endonuclease
VSGLRGYVAVTDQDWFESLRHAGLDEVNFWQPSATGVKAEAGTPWFFKLHYPTNAIVGAGFFTYYTRMPISVAWETFGTANGVRSLNQMIARVAHYRKRPTSDKDDVGCIILSSTVFLEEDEWIKAPADWAPNIVQGKYYELNAGLGLELWLQLSERLRTSTALVSPLVASPAFGKPVLIAPRLGQGAFRLQVTDAYGRRCAVTGERTLPALEAAHIYARAGQVADIALEPGGVRASVQGSRAKPYQVTIRMRELTAREWSAVGATIAANAWLAAMLLAGEMLAGEMLEDIETAFAATGTTLFPAGARCGAVAEGRPVPVLARGRGARGRACADLRACDGDHFGLVGRAPGERRLKSRR